MKFSERQTTRKGALGEEVARRHLEAKGLVVYEPVTDGAHPFDKLCASRDKRSLVVAEVKTKPARKFYPDTGIDVRHFRDYMAIQAKYGIDVHLYFVDEEARQMYGNKLTTLIAAREILVRGKPVVYPLEQSGIVYFPLEAMRRVAALTGDEADQISALSTRNEAYRPVA